MTWMKWITGITDTAGKIDIDSHSKLKAMKWKSDKIIAMLIFMTIIMNQRIKIFAVCEHLS